MRVTLACDEKLAVEHFSKTVDWYILLDRSIKISFTDLGADDTVVILCRWRAVGEGEIMNLT